MFAWFRRGDFNHGLRDSQKSAAHIKVENSLPNKTSRSVNFRTNDPMVFVREINFVWQANGRKIMQLFPNKIFKQDSLDYLYQFFMKQHAESKFSADTKVYRCSEQDIKPGFSVGIPWLDTQYSVKKKRDLPFGENFSFDDGVDIALSPQNTASLVLLLSRLNNKVAYSQDFQNEIKNLMSCTDKQVRFKHFIQEQYVNYISSTKNDCSLYSILERKYEEPNLFQMLRPSKNYKPKVIAFPMQEFRKLLAKGANPNYLPPDECIISCSLTTFIMSNDGLVPRQEIRKIIYLLLEYNVDIFDRGNIMGNSALDFMYLYLESRDTRDYGVFLVDLIQSRIIQKEKLGRNLLQVSQLEFLSRDNQIHIALNSTDFPITISMFETTKIPHDSLQELFKLYQSCFRPSPVLDGEFFDFFKYEIEGKHKFFDLFRYQNKISGMNLFEIIQDEAYPDHIFLHLSCVFMTTALRGKGLTDPLIMALGHALQILFPTKKILFVFQSISLGSANLVEGLTHYFPKYRTPFLAKLADKLIHHIQRTPSKVTSPLLVNKYGESWSPIEVQTLEDSKSQPAKLTPKELNFNLMRGLENSNENNHHGVLMMFYFSDETWLKFVKTCMLMRIDAAYYVNQLAQRFMNFIPELKPVIQYTPTFMPQHCVLFKSNQWVKSGSLISAASIPAQLELLDQKSAANSSTLPASQTSFSLKNTL